MCEWVRHLAQTSRSTRHGFGMSGKKHAEELRAPPPPPAAAASHCATDDGSGAGGAERDGGGCCGAEASPLCLSASVSAAVRSSRVSASTARSMDAAGACRLDLLPSSYRSRCVLKSSHNLGGPRSQTCQPMGGESRHELPLPKSLRGCQTLLIRLCVGSLRFHCHQLSGRCSLHSVSCGLLGALTRW